jgi:hypothetical protein
MHLFKHMVFTLVASLSIQFSMYAYCLETLAK